jgi:hypothetical protein
VPPVGPPGCEFGLPDPPEPGTVCPDGSAPRDREADRELRNILGLDETGDTPPLESYDIGCDEGSWNAFLRKIWCSAQAMPFAIGKWSIGIGIDLMDWALEFRIARSLAPLAGLLSRVYDTSLIGPLGLRHVAWTCAMFAAGWHLVRARAARGFGEIATTFVIATVGAIVLANPQGYLDGSITLAQNTSGAVLEATADVFQGTGTDQSTDVVRDRLGNILRRSFVGEPYDLINWGEPLTGECAAARDEVLAGGPWGSEDTPRDIMKDHGCDEAAEFNARPTDSRAAASLIVALAAVAATVLLVAIALVVFIAQLTLIAMFAGASLVWTFALFPGGRDVLWWWIGRLAWAVAATVGATFVLSWLAITVTAALAATSDVSIIQRCLVALLIVAFGFRLRAQVGRSVEGLSQRLGYRVAAATTSRTTQGATTFAAGAASGVGLSSMARSWAYDTPGGQYLYTRLYTRHFTRGYRRGGSLRGTRRAMGHLQSGVHRAADLGATATRGARAVAMAPIVGPAAVVATRSRATAASARARQRLRSAQATGGQWVTNATHPIRAVRGAQERLDAAERAREARRQARTTRQRPTGTRAAEATAQQTRDRVQQARLQYQAAQRNTRLRRARSAFLIVAGGGAASAAAAWLYRRARNRPMNAPASDSPTGPDASEPAQDPAGGPDER